MRVHTLFGFLCLSLGGCAAVQDCQYSMVNKFRASHAWYGSADSDGDCSHHFIRGWKRGYYDVATGSCGQAPAVPPPKYWSAKYQNLDGQQAIGDWYRGYQRGAVAAEECGHPHWNAVPSREAPETWHQADPNMPLDTPGAPQGEPGIPYEISPSEPPLPGEPTY